MIFRENTEDVYAGIEYQSGSDENKRLAVFSRKIRIITAPQQALLQQSFIGQFINHFFSGQIFLTQTKTHQLAGDLVRLGL